MKNNVMSNYKISYFSYGNGFFFPKRKYYYPFIAKKYNKHIFGLDFQSKIVNF